MNEVISVNLIWGATVVLVVLIIALFNYLDGR